MNISAIREVKLLREIEHPNVMGLQDVFSQDLGICLVFEFIQSDLEAVIRDPSVVLTPANIKSLTLQVRGRLHSCCLSAFNMSSLMYILAAEGSRIPACDVDPASRSEAEQSIP